jgi:hypothetical protein
MNTLQDYLDYIKKKNWKISMTKNSFLIYNDEVFVKRHFKDPNNIEDIIKEAIKEMEEKTTFLGHKLIFVDKQNNIISEINLSVYEYKEYLKDKKHIHSFLIEGKPRYFGEILFKKNDKNLYLKEISKQEMLELIQYVFLDSIE